MFVAMYVPHNEGRDAAIISGPGFNVDLVDRYEVDASFASFATEEEAIEWLSILYDVPTKNLEETTGGLMWSEEYF